MKIKVKRITEEEKPWVLDVVRGWGADFIVTRGRMVYPTDIEGFYAESDLGDRVGLITYEVTGDQCEAVTLDAFIKHSGVGTVLMEKVAVEARQRGCKRLWLITTNDNLDAIRFYQKRGMTIAAFHVNALEYSRRLKPSIPLIGNYGIPMRDEIEFEMWL